MHYQQKIKDVEHLIEENQAKKDSMIASKNNSIKFEKVHMHRFVYRTIILFLLFIAVVATYVLSTNYGLMSSIVEKMMENYIEQEVFLVLLTSSAFICMLLATLGAGIKGLGWVFASYCVTLLLFGCGVQYDAILFLPALIGIIKVFNSLKNAKNSRKLCLKEYEQATASMEDAESALAKLFKEKENLLADERISIQLYRDAVANGNDEQLMRQAAEKHNEDAIAYIKQLEKQREAEEAERLYQEAISKNNPDLELMEEAADKGHPLASLFIGKKTYDDVNAGMYTEQESELMLESAAHYFDVAADAGNIEAEFLAITCRVQYESYNLEEWKDILTKLRSIKKRGLSSKYNESYDIAVKGVVDTINRLDAKSSPPPRKDPVIKRRWCAFNNGGVCIHYSTSSYLAKCSYPNNPGQCSAALLEKALRFEFE